MERKLETEKQISEIKEIVENGTNVVTKNDITEGAVLTHAGTITHKLIDDKWNLKSTPIKELI